MRSLYRRRRSKFRHTTLRVSINFDLCITRLVVLFSLLYFGDQLSASVTVSVCVCVCVVVVVVLCIPASPQQNNHMNDLDHEQWSAADEE